MHKGAIIVIEDDVEIGDLIRRTLLNATSGYDVIWTQHGLGAIIQVEAQWVPLVVTDYQMYDMNGVEAIQQIKQRSPQTKIIATSGVRDEETIQEILVAGADQFLRKPFFVTDLIKSANDMLEACCVA